VHQWFFEGGVGEFQLADGGIADRLEFGCEWRVAAVDDEAAAVSTLSSVLDANGPRDDDLPILFLVKVDCWVLNA